MNRHRLYRYFLCCFEELYKTGKDVIGRFHARSERGVRQELCAAFTLTALTRQFSNRCEGGLNGAGGEEDLPDMRANFRNGLRLVGRGTEAMFLRQSQMVAQSVRRIMAGLSRCIQRERPGRSCPRRSLRPRSKWDRQAAS